MSTIRRSVYDWQEFVPVQAHHALEALGVRPGVVRGLQRNLKGAVFTFAFSGDREQAKYVVETFLQDEFGAENIRFYAKPADPSECYACFDWNRRKARG